MYSKVTLKTFGWLIWKEIRETRKILVSKIIDSIIWPVCNTLVSGYILTAMGMPADYGIFMLVGSIIAVCIWDSMGDGYKLAADISGEKEISYELTLPLTYKLVYLKSCLLYAIKISLFNILSLPLGLILMSKEYGFLNISIVKLIFVYLLSNFFIGAFLAFTIVFSKNAESYGRFWARYGAILFAISGFQFSWQTLFNVDSTIAYITLLNPFIYTFEGIRVAIMGQGGFINFWYCIFALMAFSVFFTWIGIYLFKKKLDCV